MRNLSNLQKALIWAIVGIILAIIGYNSEGEMRIGICGKDEYCIEKVLSRLRWQTIGIYFGTFGWIILYYLIKHFKVFSRLKEFQQSAEKERKRKESSPYYQMSVTELEKRAYAELKSEHYQLSLNLLNELIEERRIENFKIYSMRAECYLKLGDKQSALISAIKSVELEGDIDKNESGYAIRNQLLKEFKQ